MTNIILIEHKKTKLSIREKIVSPAVTLHYLIIQDSEGGREIAISKELFSLLKKELL